MYYTILMMYPVQGKQTDKPHHHLKAAADQSLAGIIRRLPSFTRARGRKNKNENHT